MGVLTALAQSDAAAQARERVLGAIADGASQVTALVAPPAQPGPLDRVRDFANGWQSVFAILFMAALVFVLWRTLRLMPRTRPVQVQP